MVLPFLLPTGAVAAFAWVARFAAGAFLLIQMVILLDFAYTWNDAWSSRDAPGWLAALVGATCLCYAAGLALLGLDFVWFKPLGAGPCSLNVFVPALALVLGCATTAASLHPAVPHGSLLCSSIIFLYNAYLTTSALGSEPPTYACNGRPAAAGAGGQAGGAAAMVLALASVAWSAARAGSSSAFSLGDAAGGAASDDEDATHDNLQTALIDPEDELDDFKAPGASADAQVASKPTKYSASFFHLTFALASCYTAMLLTDWGSGLRSSEGTAAGVGWASVWIKIVSSWMAWALYSLSLLAPLIWPERIFN